MPQFTHTVKDPLGLHARPAGQLAKLAKAFPDTVITITKNGQTAKASQTIKLMTLGVRQGEEITVSADGPQADSALSAVQNYMREQL